MNTASPADGLNRFARVVAVLIAAGTVVAAAVGYCESRATRADRAAASSAQEKAVLALGASVRDQERALSNATTLSILWEHQIRRANARRLAMLPSLPRADRAAARDDERRSADVARATNELLPTSVASASDSAPQELLARSGLESYRLWGLHDAEREASARWSGQVAAYAAILPVIAGAIYLFSLSLALSGRVGWGISALGLVLLTTAGCWALSRAFLDPPSPSPMAADEYAKGRVSLATGDYPEARARFAKALGVRPTHAQAFEGRARATFLGVNRQLTPYPSLVPPTALRAAASDLSRALELGLRSYGVLGNLAAYRFVEGVSTARHDVLAESVTLARRAVATLPDDAAGRYNLAVALLASGDVESAGEQYAEAVKRTIAAFPSVQSGLVGGALTDLELVATAMPDAASRARDFKEFIVGSVSLGRLGMRPSNAEFSNLVIRISPGGVFLQADVDHLDPRRSRVSVQWYRYETKARGWEVIAPVSGVVRLGPDGRVLERRALVSNLPRQDCLPAGRYRAELYADGDLRAIRETVARFASLKRSTDRLAAVSVCRPASWVRARDVIPGLSAGYVARNGISGVYVRRLFGPRSAAQLRTAASRRQGEAVGDLAQMLAMPMSRAGSLSAPAAIGDSPAQRYHYGRGEVRGEVLARTDYATDGTLVVVVAYGPRSSSTLRDIFWSVSEFDPAVVPE